MAGDGEAAEAFQVEEQVAAGAGADRGEGGQRPFDDGQIGHGRGGGQQPVVALVEPQSGGGSAEAAGEKEVHVAADEAHADDVGRGGLRRRARR